MSFHEISFNGSRHAVEEVSCILSSFVAREWDVDVDGVLFSDRSLGP